MAKGVPARSPPCLGTAAGLLAAILTAVPLPARDAFVMLSGGGTPFSNNYSQYLQAKGVAGYFMSHYPPDSVWVFFGGGNLEGQEPLLSDVRRQVKRDGLLLESWLAGPLDRNRPARRDVFLEALREEILPAVAEGGTLFLFVGDHGSQTDGDHPESVISLWEWEPDPGSQRGWKTIKDDSLTVGDLRNVLARGIGKGQVVFCMTQCHSGGFHYLAIPSQMAPNPKWFRRLPEWAVSMNLPPRALPVAGYTATDQQSPAAGCDPAPDPDTWAGYERFFPESLLGVDLFTLEKREEGSLSFAAAHEGATLMDRTIDKPCATSEQFLERWATLIETRLAGEPSLKSGVKRRVTTFQRRVDGQTSSVRDPEFQRRQAVFKKFTRRMIDQNPQLEVLLLAGTRRDLENAISQEKRSSSERTERPAPVQNQPGDRTERPRNRRGGRGGGGSEGRRVWNETLRDAWHQALEADEVSGLSKPILKFELHLFHHSDKDLDYPSSRADALREELYWYAGFGKPQRPDPDLSEALGRWIIERRRTILDWARNHADEPVRAAADKVGPCQAPAALRRFRRPILPVEPARAGLAPKATPDSPDAETAAARVLFYRRVLAAWEFLIDVKETSALERLHELIALERISLPAPALDPQRNGPREQLEAQLTAP